MPTEYEAQLRPEPFRIVVVCTANICRSPIAERLLRHSLDNDAWRLQRDVPIVVTSAGTRATDRPLPADTVGELVRLGLPTTPHTPVLLDAGVLAGADLVLGLTRDHRRSIVRVAPRMSTRSFTLVEYARILNFIRTERVGSTPQYNPLAAADFLREITAMAARLRGSMPPQGDPSELDIEDPYNRGTAVYRRVADRIADSTATIVDSLRTFA